MFWSQDPLFLCLVWVPRRVAVEPPPSALGDRLWLGTAKLHEGGMGDEMGDLSTCVTNKKLE